MELNVAILYHAAQIQRLALVGKSAKEHRAVLREVREALESLNPYHMDVSE
jgi:hypothetical protein